MHTIGLTTTGPGKERRPLRGGAPSHAARSRWSRSRSRWSRCVTLAVHSGPIWAAHHITGIRFARVGKNRDRGWRGPTRCLLDDLERKLAGAQGGHHEPPSLIGRVGLVVAPAAERDQQIQIEVGAALGALNHVVRRPSGAAHGRPDSASRRARAPAPEWTLTRPSLRSGGLAPAGRPRASVGWH